MVRKRTYLLLCCALTMLSLACYACRQPVELPVATPAEVGLHWNECAVSAPYCCEPLAWSVQHGQGRYLIWGIRDGQSYVVEITQ